MLCKAGVSTIWHVLLHFLVSDKGMLVATVASKMNHLQTLIHSVELGDSVCSHWPNGASLLSISRTFCYVLV